MLIIRNTEQYLQTAAQAQTSRMACHMRVDENPALQRTYNIGGELTWLK